MNELKTVTLANLEKSTKQEVFDWVVYNLLKQNKKSCDKDEPLACLYRGNDNTKCAAGWIIADGEYKPEFEYKKWGGLTDVKKVPDTHKELIEYLQVIHDVHSPKDWATYFKQLAEWFDLKIKDEIFA